jgi:hypothetical protein
MFVCCECCVLSGRGLCDGLITRPEESYRLSLVGECDQETSKTRRLKPATGLWKIKPQRAVTPGKQTNKHPSTDNGRSRLKNSYWHSNYYLPASNPRDFRIGNCYIKRSHWFSISRTSEVPW